MLTVQIGQCGNQLGHALFQKLADESSPRDALFRRAGDSAFFRSAASYASDCSIATSDDDKRAARAVLIDMEPKVIQQCLKQTSAVPARRTMTSRVLSSPLSPLQSAGLQWQYDASNTFTKQSGSGNNWAYGYTVHGTQNQSDLLDLIQTELERCDLHKGFLVLQSVAGGTGSGLGSFLTEQLADHYPSSYLLNTVVWPYHSGEVIVQNYNALLTMASLSAVSHGILVLQNDSANAICQKLLRIKSPSFQEMNSVLANHLASAFLPVEARGDGEHEPIGTICQELCQHPVRVCSK
uniref:Tubulin/FtsZ GTPase domain-containing protein n=1 Tax=Globisporangium ultimum (strain ATCC 200006 / CBS 805.95 / DAOM BR144) TaxID=431595 RepID=K3WCH0_GLOUD